MERIKNNEIQIFNLKMLDIISLNVYILYNHIQSCTYTAIMSIITHIHINIIKLFKNI